MQGKFYTCVLHYYIYPLKHTFTKIQIPRKDLYLNLKPKWPIISHEQIKFASVTAITFVTSKSTLGIL